MPEPTEKAAAAPVLEKSSTQPATPPQEGGVDAKLKAAEEARQKAESEKTQAVQSYQNLRTLVDRLGNRLHRLEQTATSTGGENVSYSDPSYPNEQAPAYQEPQRSGRPRDAVIESLRAESALTRFFMENDQARNYRDKIMEISQDQNRAPQYAAYARTEDGDLLVDYYTFYNRIFRDLKLQEYEARESEVAKRQAESQARQAQLKAQAMPPGAAGGSPGDDTTILPTDTPEDILRKFGGTDALPIDPTDPPKGWPVR